MTCTSGGSGACTQCEPRYYLSSGFCYSCPGNCISCSNLYYCLTCDVGYYWYTGSCESTCPSGYGINGTYCSVCSITNCAICTTNYSSCTTCSPGYFVSSNSCLRCSTASSKCTSAASDACSDCLPGYYLSGSSWNKWKVMLSM